MADEDEQVTICIRVSDGSPFTDNLTGQCSVCKEPVVYRPHAPMPSRLVCVWCWVPQPDDKLIVTRQTLRDTLDSLRAIRDRTRRN